MFFEGKEYIIANLAYIIFDISIPIYKPSRSNLVENTLFNLYLVRIKIKVKHDIGYLKRKFQSLRGLNIQIGNTQDHT